MFLYLIVSVKLQQLPVILQENCSLLPLCRPTVPVCGRCDGTLYTGWRTRAQTSAFGRSSQTGDFCPASAQRCSIPGSPRGPGRPARSPSRCWSAWNELSCRTGSQCSPREIESHRELCKCFLIVLLFWLLLTARSSLSKAAMSLHSLLLTWLW